MVVRHRGRHNRPVVLVLADADEQPLAFGFFGHRDDQFVIPLGLARPQHGQRQSGGLEHFADDGSGVLRRVRFTVSRRERKRQDQQIRSGHLRRVGPVAGVVHGLAPHLVEQRRPVIRLAVFDLDGEGRGMGDRAIEVQERQRALAADGDRFRARPSLGRRRAQGHFSDSSSPLFSWNLDNCRHIYLQKGLGKARPLPEPIPIKITAPFGAVIVRMYSFEA